MKDLKFCTYPEFEMQFLTQKNVYKNECVRLHAKMCLLGKIHKNNTRLFQLKETAEWHENVIHV